MDLLDKIGQNQLIPLVAIVTGAIVGIIAIVSGCLISHAKVRQDAELRRNMLDRGISAAEIEQAMRGFGAPVADQESLEDALWYDGELAKLLTTSKTKDGGAYSPEAIDLVLRSFRLLPANEKESIFGSIQGMIEASAGEEQLVAAVRGLCRTNDRPNSSLPNRTFDSGGDLAANLPLEMRR